MTHELAKDPKIDLRLGASVASERAQNRAVARPGRWVKLHHGTPCTKPNYAQLDRCLDRTWAGEAQGIPAILGPVARIEG
eukprot:scaffold198868_cov32-Tisochrysis_lutea.AAC.1